MLGLSVRKEGRAGRYESTEGWQRPLKTETEESGRKSETGKGLEDGHMKDRHQRKGAGQDQTRGYQCMGVHEQLEETDGEQGVW